MCGFAGFVGFGAVSSNEQARVVLAAMNESLTHRGPDSAGAWLDETTGVALGHRRLAILDLSPSGSQPMHSASARFVIVFNGEIYNHLDLRRELESADGHIHWRGHSDTETLLAGFERWGVRATLLRAVGMFAFAVYDRERRTLTLARDRLGEKPLYFGFQGEGERRTLLFGSELKALAKHPAFAGRLDHAAVHLMMRLGYVPDPHSIYAGVAKLDPGTLLSVGLDSMQTSRDTYWSLANVIGSRSARSEKIDTVCAVEELESLLVASVRGQMLADVPLGAFLSGGVDSSTIVALMQTQSSQRIKTFTIGFDEPGFDESQYATAIAGHLATDHTTLVLSGAEAREVIPHLPRLYCEPFADSSQIPTFLVSRLARQRVTVALSGDGGDELFAGYNRYVLTDRVWHRLALLPLGLRATIARLLTQLPPSRWSALLTPVMGLLPGALRLANPGEKLYKAARVLAAPDVDSLYRGVVSQWDPQPALRRGTEPAMTLVQAFPEIAGLDNVEQMMAFDALGYLPGDILVKVDRAAMGVSLETRVPLLDHRVVEWAWRQPLELKLRQGQGKWLLRQVLHRHVPRELIERPKMGFGIPIDAWLRGPLREWAGQLLESRRLDSQGLLDSKIIGECWRNHLEGRGNNAHALWNVLMFQAWLDEYRPAL